MKDFTFNSFFNDPLCWFVNNEGPKVKILPKLWLEKEMQKHLANLANAHL